MRKLLEYDRLLKPFEQAIFQVYLYQNYLPTLARAQAVSFTVQDLRSALQSADKLDLIWSDFTGGVLNDEQLQQVLIQMDFKLVDDAGTFINPVSDDMLERLGRLVFEAKRIPGRLYTPTQLKRAEDRLVISYKKYGRPKESDDEGWCECITKAHTNSMYKSNRINAWADTLINRGHRRAARMAIERAVTLAKEKRLRGPEWPDELFKSYEQVLKEA